VFDIHCHIVPGVDDGPKSWEVAVEMCRMAVADGIEHIVATPHANDRYRYDREYLLRALDRLRELVGIPPRLSLGCDFHLSYDNLQSVIADPHGYTIGGTNYLLVELSNYSVPVQVTDCFLKLGDIGLTPILTHPERNPILQRSLQRVVEWAEQGCIIQVTGSSFTGFWGDKSKEAAEWLMEREAVHILATDAHDAERRVPILSTPRDAVAEFYGAELARLLVEDNPRAIVNGQALPYFPKPAMRS
jgi:protein-tyrosine phosphatase